MSTVPWKFVAALSLVLLAPARPARAQEGPGAAFSVGVQFSTGERPVELPGPPPLDPPPPLQPPPPRPEPQLRALPAAPAGQWVSTSQYGWVWLPYGEGYTSVPQGGAGTPYAYAFVPAVGWSWVVAPWIWGIGPWPYFGASGAHRYAWYGHGWWREPARWRYVAPAHGAWGAPVRGEWAHRGGRGEWEGHGGRGEHRGGGESGGHGEGGWHGEGEGHGRGGGHGGSHR